MCFSCVCVCMLTVCKGFCPLCMAAVVAVAAAVAVATAAAAAVHGLCTDAVL